MSGTLDLLDIAGDVALLLWGTHMVTSGVLRGYGTNLRRWLGAHLNRRTSAFLFGLGVTTLLQSSTATGLMASSFAASGFLDLAPGLVVMLGANVGTTLIVQVLSFDIVMIAPVLILFGFFVHRRSESVRVKNIGRVAIGLGLMLLALGLLVRTMAPVENVAILRALLQSLISDPLLALLIAAALTWACHSSIAVVLFVTSLLTTGVIEVQGALALVLGANLGSTIPPYVEAGSAVARRLPLGNMLVRAIGCAICLPLLHPIADWLAQVSNSPARMAVNFHTAFNVALALMFILPIDSLARLLVRWLPEPPRPADPGVPLYLDESVLESANGALASAAREAMRLVDMVEQMLRGLADVFRGGDAAGAAQIGRMDSVLDRLGVAIRNYLADIGGEALNAEDGARSQEILAFVINMEHIGDIIANNLIEFATKKVNRGQVFSEEELRDIVSMHAQLMESLRLGLSVFLHSDVRAAQQLVEKKATLWRIENEAAERYTRRPKVQRDIDRDGGDVYLRILRDLKRIHSHLASQAYPILERAGLLQNRLVQDAKMIPSTDRVESVGEDLGAGESKDG
jgi:phosphate:Na+ symporter